MPREILQGLRVPAGEIEAAYREAFNLRFSFWSWLFKLVGNNIYLADAYYQEADPGYIDLIVDADQGDKEEYDLETFDCDDFAFRLMGVFHMDRETAAMPIFITWVSFPGGAHAVLSYYYDGEVRIIEPQNDEVFPVPEDWSLLVLIG